MRGNKRNARIYGHCPACGTAVRWDIRPEWHAYHCPACDPPGAWEGVIAWSAPDLPSVRGILHLIDL